MTSSQWRVVTAVTAEISLCCGSNRCFNTTGAVVNAVAIAATASVMSGIVQHLSLLLKTTLVLLLLQFWKLRLLLDVAGGVVVAVVAFVVAVVAVVSVACCCCCRCATVAVPLVVAACILRNSADSMNHCYATPTTPKQCHCHLRQQQHLQQECQ